MWKLATPVLGYVVAVDVLALVVVLVTASLVPVTTQSVLWCGLILAAGAVLSAGTGHVAPYVPYLDGFGGMTALLAAGIVYFGLNYVLVILVILMSNPGKPPRQAFGNPSDVLIVLAAVGVGCGIALV